MPSRAIARSIATSASVATCAHSISNQSRQMERSSSGQEKKILNKKKTSSEPGGRGRGCRCGS
jgi:hypothetical protein